MRYWHPKLRTVQCGEWLQFDRSRPIAVIRVVERSSPPRLLLRAETWAPDVAARAFMGYFPVNELRLGAECVWNEYQAAAATHQEEATMVRTHDRGVEWHSLLNAEERTPGVWTMVDSSGHAYGAVRIIRENGAIVYVGELRGERLGGRNVRMREAAERVHNAYVRLQSGTRRTREATPGNRPRSGLSSNPIRRIGRRRHRDSGTRIGAIRQDRLAQGCGVITFLPRARLQTVWLSTTEAWVLITCLKRGSRIASYLEVAPSDRSRTSAPATDG